MFGFPLSHHILDFLRNSLHEFNFEIEIFKSLMMKRNQVNPETEDGIF